MKFKHPIRPWESVMWSAAPVLLSAAIVALPTVSLRDDERGWRICVGVQFVVGWLHCWEIGGGQPKSLAPDVPTCDIYGPCQ